MSKKISKQTQYTVLVLLLEEKKDGKALQKLRDEIAQVMSTVAFEEEAVQTLGYSSDVFEIEAVRQKNAYISEPWVSIE